MDGWGLTRKKYYGTMQTQYKINERRQTMNNEYGYVGAMYRMWKYISNTISS